MHLERLSKEVKTFLFSFHFSNGLRTSIGAVVPSLISVPFGRLDIGIAASMGALCCALADVPGTIIHKRNGLIISTILITLTALGTGLLSPYPWFLTPWLAACGFFYAMLNIYGNRGANIGIGCLLVLVSILSEHLDWQSALLATAATFAGCVWYAILAIVLWQIRPYLTVQQTLGDCIQQTAHYLRLRANFYQSDIDVNETYRAVIAQQVVVNEKMEAVRELLLKQRSAQQGTTSISKSMVLIFLDLVDMYEQIMASQIDYRSLQQKYKNTHLIAQLHDTIVAFAEELDQIGLAVSATQRSFPKVNLKLEIEKVKREMIAFRDTHLSTSAFNELIPLESLLTNLKQISQRIYNLHRLTRLERVKEVNFDTSLDLAKFTTSQRYDRDTFKNNLTFDSHIFRHAVRVGLAMAAGYLLGHFLEISKAYWILLTIVVILKPGFSLTKSRSYQRILGTVIGAMFAVLVLFITKDPTAIFIIMLLCILGAYSYMTYNYVVSVVFTTPFIIFLLHFLHPADFDNVMLRVSDTAIGVAIAFTFNYFFWPSWEYKFLPNYMLKMVDANRKYFFQVMQLYTKQPFSITAFKLARKDVYVSTANLMAAFQRMLSEPKNKQKSASEIYHFVVLANSLSSHIAQLAAYALEQKLQFHKEEEYQAITTYVMTLIDQLEEYMKTGKHPEEIAAPAALQAIEQHLEDLAALRQAQINEGAGHTPARDELLEIKQVRDQLNAIVVVVKDMKKAAVHASAITQN
ncbi:putative membrane protein YccC [Chitinophaga skermanii]|uniref:Putative membrane protein YccC n=1 Tax=Chitinophaga skermanii TaxID=331697 RepID=A0A327QUX3_9BACT|nr:FUSC family membrane protein [Chitinophaga skermanii]RAJ08409.1 putative membrane protein YccC [Chitinophaga skermanii]